MGQKTKARYKKIYPKIWSDEKFFGLREPEKLTALYCLSSEQTNRVGLFKLSAGLAAEDLDITPKTFTERLLNVCEALGWMYDQQCRVLFIPTWWLYNQPENSNVLIGNLKDLHELPNTELLCDFADNIETLPETLHQTFTERLPKRQANRLEISNSNSSSNKSSNSNSSKKEIEKKRAEALNYNLWPNDPDPKLMADWLKVRKTKKATNTQTAYDSIGRELHKAKDMGYTVDQCIELAVTKDWKGLQASWVYNELNKERLAVPEHNRMGNFDKESGFE